MDSALSHLTETAAQARPAPRPAEAPYRPDIDGLRAIAVGAVILYHGFPGLLPGGFIGVDVFFVISGFLISGNIFRKLESGRFAFRDFYARRIRRIFPALIIVLLACLAYGFAVLLPSELALLGRNALGGAGFVSNLLLWHEAGYFDQAAVAKPLLHLWSLGVEEQFYIAWPLALWLLSRNPRRVLAFLLAAWTASLLFSLFVIARSGTADFYSPLTRLWELDSGAILAWAASYGNARLILWRQHRIGGFPLADLASLLGLALIIGAAALINRTMSFPGALALLPVAGAMLFIGSGAEALINRRLLTTRFAVFLGLISYPLYLWHWPLLSYAYVIDHGHRLKPFLVICLIALSILLAWSTWRFIERPLRFGAMRRRNTALLVAGMIAAGASGLGVWQAHGFPARFPPLPDLSVARINAAIGNGIFKPTPGMTVRKIDGITVSRIGFGTRRILFTGDSVIYQYGPRVQRLLDEGRLNATVFFAVGPSCPPVPDVARTGLFAPCDHLQAVADRLIARQHIGTVIIGASWAGYQTSGTTVTRGGKTLPMTSRTGVDALYANLEDEVRALIRAHHPVYLVLAPAADPRFDPRGMIARSPFGFKVDRDVMHGVPVAALKAANAAVDQKLKAVAAATGARILNPLPDICGAGPVCSAFFGKGTPKFADGLHLQPAFTAHHIRIFDKILTR